MISPAHRVRAAIVAVSLLLAGCGGGTAEKLGPGAGGPPARHGEAAPAPAPTASHTAAPGRLPGLGTETLAAIPSRTRQAFVVTGRGRNSSVSTAVLYERTETGWRAAGPSRPARNALRGWTGHHRAGDLRSPVGVFTLTDAGGLRPDPGTRLPYDRSGAFTSPGTGFEGEPLAGSFDYVVAVDYNRRSGTTPLDWTRPLGASRGGGIWLHVDHGGPTHGCVGLREDDLVRLMRALDPALHPVVVMGDAASLAR
ncbi:hypothetical protein CW362_01715 [Streptomyces populi]|uniref:L,D-TPase catalytic domain-containing protein n=1 Tax=Streptomyces populi TaxID=2058924 RepID=A0A2I0SXQ6_9ACTN|nr:L,D-transpeptidase family protein [Streptomyces populi]PKT74717.1 hypothetical protein CW362_01715 [Streptomyces populi]